MYESLLVRHALFWPRPGLTFQPVGYRRIELRLNAPKAIVPAITLIPVADGLILYAIASHTAPPAHPPESSAVPIRVE